MFLDDLKFFLGIVAVLAASFLAILVPVYFLLQAECNAKTESFENRFGFFEGCQIKHNGRWVDWDQFRPTDEETEE